MKKIIRVVGAVIENDGKILCVKRGPDKSLPYLWEFPGGKIEDNETPQESLYREIREELLCDVVIGDKVDQTIYEYDFATIDLTTYFCKLTKGQPKLTEHVEMKWLFPNELNTLNWAPADIPAVNMIIKIYEDKE